MLLWALSACVSIWMLHNQLYYNSGLYKFDIVSFAPLFYLWLCVVLYAMPFIVFKVDKSAQISLYSNSNANVKKLVLNIFIVFFILFAVLETYAYATVSDKGGFYSMTAGTMDKKRVMEDVMDEVFKIKFFVYSHRAFSFLSDSMLCLSVCLLLRNRKKMSLLLFTASVVPVVFGSLITGNRQKLICLIMTLFITLLIFKPFFSKEFLKNFYRIFLIFGIAIAVPVVLISVLRFGDYLDVLVYELLRYFGESCLNFASWLFPHLQGQDNGRKIFTSISRELPFYNPPVVTIGPYFYTFIGGIIQAVGRLWTFVIGLFFCASALLIKQNPRRLSFGKAVLIQTVAIMCFEGLFGFIHHLYMGAFIIGFLWILVLDTNWIAVIANCVKCVYDRFSSK